MGPLYDASPLGNLGPRVAKVVIGLLWALALWQSWECQGLFSDGSVFFLDMILRRGFGDGEDDPRAYAIILTQSPAVLAVKLGVTDLHWLARLYSLGLFGVPTALYSFALMRASRNSALLAATLMAVAIVFMTSSFFIIGEYNTGYACAILAAVWLATSSDLRARDGWVLVAIAAVSTRCYQHYLYLGPLLALMTLWAIARAVARPWLATTLYAAAAALFVVAGYIGASSLLWMNAVQEEQAYLVSVAGDATNFRLNIQLDLLVVAVAVLAAWALLRPTDLRHPWPYLTAGLFAFLVAASPLLLFGKALVSPPYSHPQTSSRTVAGPLTALFIVAIWLYASGHVAGLRALAILKEPRAGRRLVLLAGAMVVAMMPWNILLTTLYARYLDVVRTTIRAQSGPIAIEDAIFERHPWLAHNDIASDALSLAMRTSPSDGIVIPRWRKPADLFVVDPAKPPDLAPYVWRD